MKKNIFFVAFVLFTFCLFGQSQSTTEDVQVGTIFKIGNPVTLNFEHVKFPKPNMIVKRGGIANYKRVVGNIVVVSSVYQKKDGTTVIKVKRKNGKRFFGSHKIVVVHLKKALSSGELLTM